MEEEEHRSTNRLYQTEKNKKDDYFSRLPDEIIVSHILSRFTDEEATKFTILSRKWMYLWGSALGSRLIFAPEHSRTPITSRIKCCQSQSNVESLRGCYERWVSKVIRCYCWPILEELTIQFPFDSTNHEAIDQWIEFALRRGVQQLELDLRRWFHVFKVHNALYEFPTLEKLEVMLANHGGLYNLRDLSLKHVSVPGGVVEHMLARFPIERLCMETSELSKLTISELSVKLKRLELFKCGVDLKILASSNLKSLAYAGSESRLRIENVSHLSELSVDEEFSNSFLPTGLSNGGYISRLQRLEFVMSAQAVRQSVKYPLELPETLDRLEELKVEFIGNQDSCFLWPFVLIKAAPNLRKFYVKFGVHCHSMGQGQFYDDGILELRNAARRVRNHQHLTMVEVQMYRESPSIREFVKQLDAVSETLQRITVLLYGYNEKSAKEITSWIPDIPQTSNAKLVVCNPNPKPKRKTLLDLLLHWA